ncbi:hypothetical protein, partial [Micrococcus sp. GbtcB5]|uniref:hypothetical protein n=1 Tax=Micrococcus sp. GbtcB5 TaxID=2824750 RepID=UPI001C2FEAFB
ALLAPTRFENNGSLVVLWETVNSRIRPQVRSRTFVAVTTEGDVVVVLELPPHLLGNNHLVSLSSLRTLGCVVDRPARPDSLLF